MSDFKDLKNAEAQKKVAELVKETNFCLFTTDLTQIPLSTRPMSHQRVDDDGTIWFMSEDDSHKNEHIRKDNRVQLFYVNTSKNEFLNIFGKAEITRDKEMIKELWSPFLKTWFDSPDNPKLTLLKVIPEEGYYWDTKNGKLVSMLKMVAGAITGKELDDSIEGKIQTGR